MLLFGALFMVSMVGLISYQTPTGFATEGSTTSNVTITTYLSIAFSNNLSGGITYGSVSSLPAYDLNASSNYDAGPGINGTTYYLNVSIDSNTPVDFCIKGNTHLTSSGADIIGLGNETYLNSSSTSGTIPGLSSSSTSLTTSYVKASMPTAQGNSTYYRFWLDIPAATPAGTYNNSVDFKGVSTGSGC